MLPDDSACHQGEVLDTRVDVQVFAPDGESLQASLLRSGAWVSEHAIVAGSWAYVDLPDVQAEGWAQVVRVEPVPPPSEGTGCLVTGLFQRDSEEVVTLHLEDARAVEATWGHRLFSQTRGDWIAAGDAVPGEMLRTSAGTAVAVETVDREPHGRVAVYNLEVSAVHRYFVGDARIDAHNAGPTCGSTASKAEEPHLNSKTSTAPNHRYVIKEGDDVVKTGISGRPLNANGSSPRANTQINKLNKAAGHKDYTAEVVEENIPGRTQALANEQAATNDLNKAGNSLKLQTKPQPQ